MDKCTTVGPVPQAVKFPLVSHRLMVRVGAVRNANRRGVPVEPVLQAIDSAWRRTGGDRFATRRAGWAAVDRLMGQGRARS